LEFGEDETIVRHGRGLGCLLMVVMTEASSLTLTLHQSHTRSIFGKYIPLLPASFGVVFKIFGGPAMAVHAERWSELPNFLVADFDPSILWEAVGNDKCTSVSAYSISTYPHLPTGERDGGTLFTLAALIYLFSCL
jgi:hypothetical protein